MQPPATHPQSSNTTRSLRGRTLRCLVSLLLAASGLVSETAMAQTFRNGVVYELESQVAPAMALDVASSSTASGANVQIWTYGGGNNQKWKAIDVGGGYFSFAPLH